MNYKSAKKIIENATILDRKKREEKEGGSGLFRYVWAETWEKTAAWLQTHFFCSQAKRFVFRDIAVLLFLGFIWTPPLFYLLLYIFIHFCIICSTMYCCSRINSHNQVRGHRTGAPVTLELRNTPGKKRKQTKGGTRIPGISQLTQSMPPPETDTKWNRESAYDVPGPYWCINLTTRARKNRL